MSFYEEIEYLPSGNVWYILQTNSEDELMQTITPAFLEWARENNVTRMTYGTEEQFFIDIDDVLLSLL